LQRISEIVVAEEEIRANHLPKDAPVWQKYKAMGFSDARIAQLANVQEEEVLAARLHHGIGPVFKRIDTCAAEFASATPYLYSTYEGDGVGKIVCEANPSDRKKIIILGGGPNRIGQGIEFDYCCVHAVMALREAGFEAIMINCNPETVSTDYDISDRLYFEPLTAEDVIEIVIREKSNGELLGVIVQFGGQTPLKLARALEDAHIPILGTTPDAIDLAEDRERFQQLLKHLGLRQPPNGLARSIEEAEQVAAEIGYPVVVRPSYVLGGRAMEIVYNIEALRRYTREAVQVSGSNPVLIDHYLQDAIEVDVDVVADGEDVFVAGVMEHIEEAGIHSGDSSCALPPHSLPPDIVREIKKQAEQLAKAIEVVGLMNVQFAVKDGTVFVLEVNPRASRTVPFVAKAIGQPIAKIAARVMAGEKLKKFKLAGRTPPYLAVKTPVFPFARFSGVDIILGPEMKSTGEVMGLDRNFARAFAKAQIGAGVKLPQKGVCFISVKDGDKASAILIAWQLVNLGFTLIATAGTAASLHEAGVPVTRINKVYEGQPHVVDAMINGEVQLMINTTAEGAQTRADSFSLRRTALMQEIPYYTTIAGARAAVEAIAALQSGSLEVASLQSYLEQS
jgi:carbamoyl-phosphate synthase large subunit